MRSMRLRAFWALVVVISLAGCYPDLDWRELQSREGGFAVMFPARPKEATRDITLGGTSLRMHMLRAEVKGMAFGVAYADVPNGIDARILVAAARDGLVHNIGGRMVQEQAISLPGLEGLEFRAEGKVEETPTIVAARVLIGSSRFYQVSFLGPRAQIEEVDLPFYLGSFRSLQ